MHWVEGDGKDEANQLLLSALTYFFQPQELSLSLFSATVTLPWGGSVANPYRVIPVPASFLNVTRERQFLLPGGHKLYLLTTGHLVPFSHLPKTVIGEPRFC